MIKFDHVMQICDLAGPIFKKEMILASRKRRNYALRTAYIGVMLIVIASSWAQYGFFQTGTLTQTAGMSDLGRYLIISICIFQFFALQLIAPVMTGGAISEEIRKQTLQTLLMTPLTSMQIIVGKLTSRMLLMFLLVATSFPLLAIITSFGGVEWSTVFALEGLTLCAALFSAALALTFSTRLKKNAHDPAALTILVLLILYIALPLIAWALSAAPSPEKYFSIFNPFFSIIQIVANTLRPTAMGYIGLSSPPVQCALLLLATLILVIITSASTRKLANRLIANQLPTKQFRKIENSRFLDWASDRPILWRELKRSVWRSKLKRNLAIIIAVVGLIASYGYFWEALQSPEPHIAYVEFFFLLVLARAAGTSASGLAKEKDANTLELILTTPLTPRRILYDKIIAILPELLVFEIILFAHLMFFSFISVISPENILFLFLLLNGPLIFIIGTGTYFSVSSKTARSAVVKNQILGLVLWLPSCCPISHLPVNPFISAGMCLTGRGGFGSPFHFSIQSACLVSLIYAIIGIVLYEVALKTFYRYTLRK